MPLENPRTTADTLPAWHLLPFTNAYIWVDNFFLMTGFLIGYCFFTFSPQTSSYVNSSSSFLSKASLAVFLHFQFLLHRYLRLTPSVAAVLGLSILVEPFGSGPRWYKYVEKSIKTCHQDGWYHLLYIANLLDMSQAGRAMSEVVG